MWFQFRLLSHRIYAVSLCLLLVAGCSSSSDSQTIVENKVLPALTHITFDITVPAYDSSTLQVSLVWGDVAIAASRVGEKAWTISEDLPANTQNKLIVSLYDKNGEIPLGTFEADYKTGTSVAGTMIISAEQFDTERWDSNNNGVSNLVELRTGENPF